MVNNSIRRGSLALNLDHELNERITLGVNLSLSRGKDILHWSTTSRFCL